jgi:hypothetical protein
VVYEQVIKNESKQEWRHPYISIAKGLKSSPNVCSMYDHDFSWTTIIIACVIIIDVRCTIFGWVKLTMMTSNKVQKSFLVTRISIHCQMWGGKRWDLPLNMCSTFQNNSYNSILKCIMGYYTFTPIGASK